MSDHLETLAPGQYAVAPDADQEPTLWRGNPDGLPIQVLRRCDLTPGTRDAWFPLVGSMVAILRVNQLVDDWHRDFNADPEVSMPDVVADLRAAITGRAP